MEVVAFVVALVGQEAAIETLHLPRPSLLIIVHVPVKSTCPNRGHFKITLYQTMMKCMEARVCTKCLKA